MTATASKAALHRRHREELGLSQTEIGRVFGVTQATISRLETTGHVGPRTDALLHVLGSMSGRRRVELGAQMRAELQTRGELSALWLLLDTMYGPPKDAGQ